MSIRTLKAALDELCKDVVFDTALINQVYKFHTRFLNQSQEYLSFFAGNLIGVHVVRWRVADTQRFMNEVLKLDHLHVEKEIDTVTTIDHSYPIESDALNLVLMYMIHRFISNPKLNDSQRQRGAYDVALIFFCRCLVIRQSDYFNFPADPHIAQAAYAELSNKFLIKQLGSWIKVLDYRASDLSSPRGIHYNSLLLFEDDDRVTYAIGDSENRIRELYKGYSHVFHNTYSTGGRIGTIASTIIDVEGVEKIREKSRHTDQAIMLIQSILPDVKSFVKLELVQIIVEINTNTSQRMLVQVLNWLSGRYMDTQWHRKVEEFIRLTIMHSYHLVDKMGVEEAADLASVLVTLKNLYLSTRSSDPELMKIRKLGETLIKQASGPVNPSLEMATRTSVILYITLRALIGVKN